MSSTATATVAQSSTHLSVSEKDTSYVPRGPVEAVISFSIPPSDGSRPYQYVETPQGEQTRNYHDDGHSVTITDIRHNESQFKLDYNAFEALGNIHSTAEPSFTDEENIKSVYYPEVERLILDNVPGANRVFIFDHTIRRSHSGAKRTPALKAHIDQTPASAEARVRYHLPEESEQLLKGRYRIINVWRPINGPVQAYPLAFAKATSVSDQDIMPVELRYPNRNGETAAIKYADGQEWHYWSGMTNDERLLLKCADSKDVPGKRVPHTAFVDPRTPAGAPERESIEVRALVFG
ncbi:methyltransferase [Histoplasma capsulatum var. duboisii H88]|uniref:Methyltransferase n=2 Tax=Ajellomyces capsulatus TaxID=5037 RepID=A0A8A1LD62_AJEC8|nr:methyltransferase [Histoplasma capsulatum H143]QSS49697.1 methyltransferase [Histoplasma capsulatum var. duboisii H88]